MYESVIQTSYTRYTIHRYGELAYRAQSQGVHSITLFIHWNLMYIDVYVDYMNFMTELFAMKCMSH